MENNKFNLSLESALECGDKYVDSLIDTMSMMKEQINNPERLELQLNEIRRDTDSYKLMTTEFYRLIKEDDYQAAFNQYMINILYEKFRDEVLPGDDMSVLSDYLNELDENELLKNITEEIEDYIINVKCDKFVVLGYRSEYRHADDCEEDYINEEIVITLKRINGGYYEIRAYEDGENLGHSYNTRGYATIEKVNKPFITSKIKEPTNILLPKEIDDVNIQYLNANDNPVDLVNRCDDYYFKIENMLEVDYDGEDNFYPSGYMKFNKDLFEKPDIRQMTKRPVWIFKGYSGLGKSYISSIIERLGYLSIFETDAIKDSEIKGKITDDIIVVGNKHGFELDYIKSFVPNHEDVEFIEVNFSR